MDGHRVKWGVVYRSNHLAGLTAADYAHLNRLGIRLVCDLRTDGERKRAPTVWQGGAAPEILIASVMKDADVVITPDRLRELAAPRAAGALSETYARMVTESPEMYGAVLRRIANGPLPSVTHCSAGKDRTGVFSAILLTLLGVPRDAVVDDYMLTGKYMLTDAALAKAQEDFKRITGSETALDVATLRGIYTMHEEALIATFDAIDTKYGSFDAFVRDGLKLTSADVTALKTRLLE
jgi:protein-tyrosine phosphatase